ncbi:MAG TPA: glycosyltransferase family 1 protein [Patescibacteria group bacterium]|nr:glycosyltransferase family 1 protein [Patescibacteria group bacterium]
MKIGIDARLYGSGFGLARYVRELVDGLVQDKENEYVFFLRKENFDLVPTPSRGKKVLADIPWYSFAEQLKMGRIIDQEKLDLVHCPHWNVPLLSRSPLVMTIHDLIMFHFPRPEATTLGPVRFWLKDQAHRFILQQAARRARRIITTSEFTKQDLLAHLRLNPEKITVLYQAPFTSVVDPVVSSRVKEKVGERPYGLYVGACYPHKNVDALLRAWSLVREKTAEKYQLVLVGPDNYFSQRLRSGVEYHSLGEGVKFLGPVSDAELVTLYQGARLFVYPSLYEGFGLPPLEAMAHNLPVVCSNASCLPEVVGEAALYFDPSNEIQMAEVIIRGLEDEDCRWQLQEAGKENLGRFSQEKFRQQTKEVYRSI